MIPGGAIGGTTRDLAGGALPDLSRCPPARLCTDCRRRRVQAFEARKQTNKAVFRWDLSLGATQITHKIKVISCCQVKQHRLKTLGNESEISF